jgi:GTPase
VGAGKVPTLEVFNKCDRLEAGERARLDALYPGGLTVSALTGEGRDDLIAAMEGRLALDTTRVTLSFDLDRVGDRERIAQVYRIGRILRHVAADGHVTIEAELPRRMLDRLEPARAPLQGG